MCIWLLVVMDHERKWEYVGPWRLVPRSNARRPTTHEVLAGRRHLGHPRRLSRMEARLSGPLWSGFLVFNDGDLIDPAPLRSGVDGNDLMCM